MGKVARPRSGECPCPPESRPGLRPDARRRPSRLREPGTGLGAVAARRAALLRIRPAGRESGFPGRSPAGRSRKEPAGGRGTGRCPGPRDRAPDSDRSVRKGHRTSRGHHFHVWEGGEDVHGRWVEAHLLRGREALAAGKSKAALGDFETALTYPANFDVGAPSGGGGSAKIYYYIGIVNESAGDRTAGTRAFERAAALRPGWSEDSYFLGLALRKLGREAEAVRTFRELAGFASDRLKAAPKADFFEKFGERQSARVLEARDRLAARARPRRAGERRRSGSRVAPRSRARSATRRGPVPAPGRAAENERAMRDGGGVPDSLAPCWPALIPRAGKRTVGKGERPAVDAVRRRPEGRRSRPSLSGRRRRRPDGSWTPASARRTGSLGRPIPGIPPPST